MTKKFSTALRSPREKRRLLGLLQTLYSDVIFSEPEDSEDDAIFYRGQHRSPTDVAWAYEVANPQLKNDHRFRAENDHF